MQIALTLRNNSWNVKRRLLHRRGSGMCYITRGPLRVVISNISDGGCLIFLNTDFADAHWKVMYCTLLATCGSAEMKLWRVTFRLFFEHGFCGFCGCSLKGNVPHVARNVWLSGNVGSLITTSKSTNIWKSMSHTLLFMLMTKQKPKFF